MTEVDFLIEPEWLIQVVPDCHVKTAMAVIIHQDKILDVLPKLLAHSQYSPKQIIKLEGQVLIPGLINLHTHAAMSLMRGLADDIPLMDWLKGHIWPAEQAVLSDEFVHDGTLLASAEMLMCGVTCFNDMYFYPQSAAHAATQAGIRAHLGLVVLEFPTQYASDADDYIRRGLEARDAWRELPLISSCLAPHAPYTIEDSTFNKVMTFAEQLDLGVHIHLHETQEELAGSREKHHVHPVQRLKNLGVLGPHLLAAHCVHMQASEMALLAEHGCHVVHCPHSNLKLASGIAPITAMMDAGINIGLGTDGCASNNRLDMFAEMRLASLLAKGATGDASALNVANVLSMATINAAKSLSMESKLGSIEVGKQADLVAVKLTNLETSPCFDPLSQLVHAAGREHVTHVWVAGGLRYQKLAHQQGVFAGIEPNELKEITSKWHSRLKPFKA